MAGLPAFAEQRAGGQRRLFQVAHAYAVHDAQACPRGTERCSCATEARVSLSVCACGTERCSCGTEQGLRVWY
eukprot:3661161-Rhodomonas_salina.1